MKSHKIKNIYLKYNVILISLVLIPLSLIGLLNFVIDPYGVFNTIVIQNLNYVKPELDKHQRLVKSAYVINYKPQKVLMGSSTVLNGLNPSKISIDKEIDTSYNLGISSVNMKEMKLYFEHLLLNQPELKTVFLGLNFFMFNHNKDNSVEIGENIILKKNIYLNRTI